MALFKFDTKDPESLVVSWMLILGGILIISVLFILIFSDYSTLFILTFLPLLIAFWLIVTFHVSHRLRNTFYGLANVIESLRVGDYSLRVSQDDAASAWSEVYSEVNQLAKSTQEDRWQSVESTILLDKLLAEFDIPVFIFDKEGVLQNLNQSGCGLFPQKKEDLLGLQAIQLHMTNMLSARSGEVIEHWFPHRGGRWELSRNTFIQEGKRFTLLFVNDLSQALREEERLAWQKLVRVLGHELNNSLASIISVSDGLLSRIEDREKALSDAHFQKSIGVITERSHSLLRFTESYTQLAKLPSPKKSSIDLRTVFERITTLIEGNFAITTSGSLEIEADPDQLEQMFINLLKNAVEASSIESQVEISWQTFEKGIRLNITDQGMGLPSSDNLFVPFFTTKKQGNGIGLFLCRQIAEAHGGGISLEDRQGSKGCIVKVWLPR